MKKKIYKEPGANEKNGSGTVIFEGKEYSVIARSVSSVRIARQGEEIIVAADRVEPAQKTEAKQEDPEE